MLSEEYLCVFFQTGRFASGLDLDINSSHICDITASRVCEHRQRSVFSARPHGPAYPPSVRLSITPVEVRIVQFSP